MNIVKRLPIAIAMATGLGISGHSLAVDLNSSSELDLNAKAQSQNSGAVDTRSASTDGSASGAISNESRRDIFSD